MKKIVIAVFYLFVLVFSASAATLSCQQISETSQSIPQFSSSTIEIRCSASGGTVSNIQITPNSNPSTGLTITSSQTISSSISDQSSSTAKWSATGDSPNTYTVSYTVSSDGTNSWSGASTTTVSVPSPAQLSVEYVLPPSIFAPAVETLDFQITNIGGTSATNVKMKLNNGSLYTYPTSIEAGASASYSWTNSTGFNVSGEYTTYVYIADTLHDSVTATVLTGEEGINATSGWSLISYPKQPDNTSVVHAVEDISSIFTIIYRYDGGVTWKSYDGPGGSPDTLTTISSAKGYWLKTTQSTQLNFTGTEVSSMQINLTSGWNLIGYPKSTTTNLTTTMADILNNVDTIFRFDGGVTWKSYDGPGGSPDTLTTLTPGKGYYVKMNNADTLSVIN
ncbi:MAG: hypothetical protein V1859_10895 [archaeon]